MQLGKQMECHEHDHHHPLLASLLALTLVVEIVVETHFELNSTIIKVDNQMVVIHL
jgi:hypothetical protein